MVKFTLIHVLLELVASHDLEFEQIDVKNTFCNRDFRKENYLQQQEGFEVKGKEDHECLLNKSLCKLK